LGDNLYSCSVIALDADTGKLSWHYQFNPHNEFDWDATQVPVLADIEFAGRPTKAMLWANRNGVFYVIDRVSGKFLQGKSFVKTNWYTGFDEKGRPIVPADKLSSKAGTLIYPGNQGGTNFYNPSFSPVTGLFYIPAWENSSTTYVIGEEPPEFHEGQSFSGPFPKGGNNTEDQHSAIVAMDPKTGTRKWTHRLNANQTEAGVMTTASNVLISGGRNGDFYALDARDGKLLWRTNLGPSIAAGPMTFMVANKQYITIQAGTSIFTFGLRE
jgi:alcohol dehydrogenase (cytochrome c)